ncbi:MAG TPA: hypothetical protein VMX38_10615 [Verrucomicrobiae bacterium]|nr:hypothetical protein [Verrucomicrobiae bacterium]
METLTRLVSESLARHGLDRPLDYRRLQWSRWFRCESLRSLLQVPSKPGVFAVAEEIAALGTKREGHDFSRAENSALSDAALAAAGAVGPTQNANSARHMLAVTQFFEDDDMAFTLDRMLTWQNPMRVRLSSGRYFIRYVIIQDAAQRRSICSALNQWIANSTEKATGIGAHFATSLEFTESNVVRTPSSAQSAEQPASAAVEIPVPAAAKNPAGAALLLRPASNGSASNVHCPPFPSGF